MRGEAALEAYRGTASCLGGYIQVAEKQSADIEMGIASAPPSGPVENAAYEYISVVAILELAGQVDALLLDLHGAMTTKSHEDGEGELLRRIRAENPKLPIAISLDMHANITELMVSNCDVLTGYHTYPTLWTAQRCAALTRSLPCYAWLINACVRWGNAPMLPHVMRQGTDDEPNGACKARAIDLEQSGSLGERVHRIPPRRHLRRGIQRCCNDR